MTQQPLSFSVAVVLVFVNAIIWLVFATSLAGPWHPAMPEGGVIRGVMAILGYLTAGVLIVLAILLVRRSRIAYYLTLSLLVVITIAIVVDQFGIPDLVVLIITVIPFPLLIKDRRWYFGEEDDTTPRA